MNGWKFVENPPFAAGLFSAEQTEVWENLKQELLPGTLLSGPVFIQALFGVFFDTGLGFPALLEVHEFQVANVRMSFPEGFPSLGSIVSGKLCGFYEEMRQLRVTRSNT